MKIKQIQLKNFKIFSDVTIDLNGKSTVIFGENGFGKTSIINAINLLSWNWIYRLCQNQKTAFRSLNSEMVRKNTKQMEISSEFVFDDDSFTLKKKYTKADVGKSSAVDINKKLYDIFVEEYLKRYKDKGIPIMVNYGTNRSVLDIPLRIKKKHNFDKWAALENSLENTLDFKAFFEWIRYREDYELEVMRDKRNFDYKDPLLECVRKALLGMLDGFSDIKVKRNPLRLTIKKNNIEFSIDQLSDGEKCTLALFGDLSRRLGMANPDLENPLLGKGIVMIDEIELHMHPAWQRKILGALKSTFPNIQFIVTTHSPQVLSEVDNTYCVVCLKSDGIINSIGRLDGYDINTILEEKMGTSSINELFQNRVDNVYKLIHEGQFEEAEKEISEIQSITDNNSQSVIKLEGSLKIGKILYDQNNKKK